jgi:hypothetical protein
MKSIAQWWRIHFLGAELGLAVVITLVFPVWVEKCSGSSVVNRVIASEPQCFIRYARFYLWLVTWFRDHDGFHRIRFFTK